MISKSQNPDAGLISKQITRYKSQLVDLLFYKKDLVPKLLSILTKEKSSLVKKTQLKKLFEMAPWCVTTMKCLMQAYHAEAKKQQ